MKKKYLYNNQLIDESDVIDAAKASSTDLNTYIQKAGMKAVDNTYSFKGKDVSAEDILSAANQSKLGFDDYIQKAGFEKKNLVENGSPISPNGLSKPSDLPSGKNAAGQLTKERYNALVWKRDKSGALMSDAETAELDKFPIDVKAEAAKFEQERNAEDSRLISNPKDAFSFDNVSKQPAPIPAWQPPQSLHEATEQDKSTSKYMVGNLYNSLLHGYSSITTGMSDLMGQLIIKMMPPEPGMTKEESLKKFRNEFLPAVRTGNEDLIGANVTPKEKENFNNNFWTSALGSITESVPGILSPSGSGLLAQAYDGGLQAINSTKEGQALPESTKSIFAGGLGAAQAVIFKLGLDKIFGKQTTKMASNLAIKTFSKLIANAEAPITAEAFETALNLAAKDLKSQVIKAGGKLASSAATGAVMGGAIEGTNLLAQEIMNKSSDKDIFEPTSWGEKVGQIAHAAASNAVGGGLLGMASLPFSKTRNYIAEKVADAKSQDDIIKLKQELIDKSPEMSPEETQQLNGLVDQYVKVNSKIPDSVSNRKEAAEKIIEREDIQNEISKKQDEVQNVDEAFKPAIHDEINALNGRADEINQEIVNGEPENISKPIELTIGEKQEWDNLPLSQKLQLARENLPEVSNLSDIEIAKAADKRAKELLTIKNNETQTTEVFQPTETISPTDGEANQNIQPAEETTKPEAESALDKAEPENIAELVTEPKKEDVVNKPEGDNRVGVSHKSLTELSEKLGLKEPEPGGYITPEEYADRGRRLLEAGADPNEVNNPNNELHDRISIARAHLEDLTTTLNKAGDDHGIESQEYKDAQKATDDYANNVVKKLGTSAHRAFTSLQGERDLDTGSFTAIRQAKIDATGKPQTDLPRQIKELSKKVKDIEESNNRLQKKYEDALNKNKGTGDESGKKGKFEKKATEIANKILKSELPDWLKIDDSGETKKQGIGADEVKKLLADATINMGKFLDKGVEFAEAVKEAVKDLVKSLGEDKRDEIEKGFLEHYTSNVTGKKESELSPEERNINRLQKELAQLQDEGKLKDKNKKRELSDEEKELHNQIEQEQDKIKYNNLVTEFADKKDNKFTPEQSSNIWDYAKKTYINDNPNYKLIDMVNNVGMDLGLSPEQVRNALGATPETKRITDELYRNQYEKNKASKTIQQWVHKSDEKPIDNLFNTIAAPFRGLATLGHGHALLFTHAGMNLFDPQIAKKFLSASVNQFKIVYGNDALYQKTISDFKADPLYTKALRSGVGIDPNTVYDDWQLANNFLKKLKVQGNKGFLILKMLRLEVWKNEYNKLSAIEKADPESLKAVAQLANHWTGTAGLKVSPAANAFIFAPNLIVSKFARLTTDPTKALITLGKMSLGKDVPLDQKVAAKIIFKKSGRIMAMYAGALAANQGMLYVTGSNQSVNFLNPTKSDWLKFKTGDVTGGKTVDVSSGVVSTMQFLTQLAILPFESQKDIPKDYHGDKSARDATKDEISGFVQKILSPFGGTVWDFLSHKDYAGNVLPPYNDKVAEGKEKLSWKQYIAEKLPIPIAEGIKTFHDQMIDEGVDGNRAAQIAGGILIAAIASTGVKIANSPKDIPKQFTNEELKDPIFKSFAGIEMPNILLSSEQITNEKEKLKTKVSDYPKEVQDQYQAAHKEAFKKELSRLVDKDRVYVKYYKDAKGNEVSSVSLEPPETGKSTRVELSHLSEKEKMKVLSLIQSNATEKAKKEIFYKKPKP